MRSSDPSTAARGQQSEAADSLHAWECSPNLVAATHCATETFGVKSLGDLIEERFGLPCIFIVEQDGIR